MGSEQSTMTSEAAVDRQLEEYNEEWHIRSSCVSNSSKNSYTEIEIVNEQLVVEKETADQVQLKEKDEESHDRSPDVSSSSSAKRGNTLRSDPNLSISENIVDITTPLQQDGAAFKNAWKIDPPCVLEKPLSVTHQLKLNIVKECIPRLAIFLPASDLTGSLSMNLNSVTSGSEDTTLQQLEECISTVTPRSEDTILQQLDECISTVTPRLEDTIPQQLEECISTETSTSEDTTPQQLKECISSFTSTSEDTTSQQLEECISSVTPKSEDTIPQHLEECISTVTKCNVQSACLPEQDATPIKEDSPPADSGILQHKDISNKVSAFDLLKVDPSFQFMQDELQFSSSVDNYFSGENVMNRNGAHALQEISNIHSTTPSFVGLDLINNSSPGRLRAIEIKNERSMVENEAADHLQMKDNNVEIHIRLSDASSSSLGRLGNILSSDPNLSNTEHTVGIAKPLHQDVTPCTRPRKTDLPCVLEKPLNVTNQFTLNPGAKAFIPRLKNQSSLSANDTDKNHNVEQTRETPDPDNTLSTSNLTGSLSTNVNGVTPRSEDTIPPRVLEKSLSVTNQNKLNPGANEFIPRLKNRSSLSAGDGDKNHNVELTHETSDPDNTASTWYLTGSLSTNVNSVTSRSEGTFPRDLEERISPVTPRSEDTMPQQLEECISTGTPRSEDTISQHVEECISIVTECHAQRHCPPEQESTKIKEHLQPVESGILPHMACSNKLSVFDPLSVDTSYEYMLDGLEFRVSGDNYFSEGNVLNQDAAHASQEMSNIHSTTSAPAFVGFSDQLPSKVDFRNSNFCRTPGCKCHNGLRCHGDKENAQSEIDGTDPKRQEEEMNILSEEWYLENDDFLDGQNQQAAAGIDHNNENWRDVTDLNAIIARTKRSARKWNMNVSSWAIDLERRKIREQLYMIELHRAMGGYTAQSVDMQKQMVDMLKQVAISRINLKMLEADHQMRQLNSIPSTLTTREMDNIYEELGFYMTDCNILKITVEIFALDLVEQVMSGSSVDWSSIDLQAPNFLCFLPSYPEMTLFQEEF